MSPNRLNDARCHIRKKASPGGGAIYHICLDSSMADGMAAPDYVVIDMSLHQYVGRLAYVTHAADGAVTLRIPPGGLILELGELPWLNEPKPAQPEPVKPPADCMAEHIWLELRVRDLALSINDQLTAPGTCDWKLLADRAEQLTRHAEWLGHWHP